MRQRKIKYVENKISEYENFLARNPESFAGRWREAFGYLSSAKLYIEIGSGKGRFLLDKAASDLNSLYIGFEGQLSCLYRALTKAYKQNPFVPLSSSGSAIAPRNFYFCPEYVSDVRELFTEGEVDGIYLNFSDPWPKARQEKRRLTSPVYLTGYLRVLATGGFLEFKTDNDTFFEYSAEQFLSCQGFELIAVTDNLHSSRYAAGNVETEYEHKFRNLNRRIHFLRVVKV